MEPGHKALFAVIHGRDSLDTLFPKLYNAEDNATRQAEEFHQIVDGGDYGWPYTFVDNKLGKRVLAPEYGGDAKKEPEAGKYPESAGRFPAHWAPNDLLFYSGKNFPAKYQDGAFIAFHGSWNRAPEPQAGYKVVFQPMKDGKANGSYEVFADGFAGEMKDNSPRNALYRPVGLAVGPDGSLYVSDSQKGRVWRISYARNDLRRRSQGSGVVRRVPRRGLRMRERRHSAARSRRGAHPTPAPGSVSTAPTA